MRGRRCCSAGAWLAGDGGASVGVYVLLVSFVATAVCGLGLDLTQQVYAQDHARDLAQQAARAAVNAMPADVARGCSSDPVAASAEARKAASKFVRRLSGWTASASFDARSGTVTVTVSGRWRPVFARWVGLGLDGLPVEGVGSAKAGAVVDGAEVEAPC